MIIRLERSSGIPITRQLLDQLRAQCATGALRPGDKLPSVRELARELVVNQNTVLHVYERLETEGLIERRHGAGTFVADPDPDGHGGDGDGGGRSRGLMEAQRVQLAREAEALVHRAQSLGVGLDALTALIEDAFTRHNLPADSSRSAEKDE